MDKKALQQAIKACVINDIYLRGTSVRIESDFDPVQNSDPLDIQYKVTAMQYVLGDVADAPVHHVLRVRVETGLRYLTRSGANDNEKSSSVVAEVEATFIAQYTIADEAAPSDECLKEFSRLNAPYHVWPYWREYAHDLCGRHRLPVVVLPMLTVDQLENSISADPPAKVDLVESD